MYQQQNINDFRFNLRNAYPFNEYCSLVLLYGERLYFAVIHVICYFLYDVKDMLGNISMLL